MKISASDPDIETLVSRIKKRELNLRPDFQRGEVWSEGKRQKLIDTILRGWQVPPVHLVSLPGSELEVLDGQQRLAAIRDFAADRLRIDGRTKPLDKNIAALDGRVFSTLSPELQRRFNQYPIRVFAISEYEPDEPYELFYRLNQPTTLTAAEQRNAFFGPAREQVKSLVSLAQEVGFGRDTIGFANGRMAYDDVLARACMFREAGSFHAHVTAATLNDKYRSPSGFRETVLESIQNAIRLLAIARSTFGSPVRLNKATFLSWLLFACDNDAVGRNGDVLARYLSYFEHTRSASSVSASHDEIFVRLWIQLYEDRASSRVNDTLSVASRDFVLWLFFAGSDIGVVSESIKLTKARDAFAKLSADVAQGRFLEPAGVVQQLLDRRRWDLTYEGG